MVFLTLELILLTIQCRRVGFSKYVCYFQGSWEAEKEKVELDMLQKQRGRKKYLLIVSSARNYSKYFT